MKKTFNFDYGRQHQDILFLKYRLHPKKTKNALKVGLLGYIPTAFILQSSFNIGQPLYMTTIAENLT